MNRQKIAQELVAVARELTARLKVEVKEYGDQLTYLGHTNQQFFSIAELKREKSRFESEVTSLAKGGHNGRAVTLRDSEATILAMKGRAGIEVGFSFEARIDF